MKLFKAKKKIFSLVALLVIMNYVLMLNGTVLANVCERTYTLDADFDEGVLAGVEHETVHDQLQLSKHQVVLPFIWVPNFDGTVSKLSTETGNELGRYRVGPPSLGDPSPSRTTVDLQGSCWVGNRQAGTVVKIGLSEAGQYIDRNSNGTMDTSTDLDNDGNITGAEILPWGQDECVLYEVILIPGWEGTYAPGTYGGPYDTNYWGVAPRGLAIDANNNLWAGTWSTSKFYEIDGSTGAILNTLDVSSPWGHHSYGAVIDSNGILLSAHLYTGILRINTLNLSDITSIPLPHTYGLGLDYLGHLFVGGSYQLSRIDIATSTLQWTQASNAIRGVCVTPVDNNVWVAGLDATGTYKGVSRYDNAGNLLATITVGLYPSGVGVDAAGKVWVCDIGDEYIHRINPATNTVDLSKQIVGSGGHYTYSDMTGIVSRTITSKTGTWTVDHDSGTSGTPWGTVSWTSDEPAGTSVAVKVRSSDDKISWSGWENASNGIPLSFTPNGRYLQVESTLKITLGDVSPILYDLTVKCANQPPDVSNAYLSQTCIWPPNHKFVDITIGGVIDPDGDPVTITVTKITSDEPTKSICGAGGTKHAPDADGVGTSVAKLRAERTGTGNGRVYMINFVASDGKGGETTGSVKVNVPHDQSDNCQSTDDGQNYDATQIN